MSHLHRIEETVNQKIRIGASPRVVLPVLALAWVVLFFADDFSYYWFHRIHHECRLFWASHVVHHSSQRYNLTDIGFPTKDGFWVSLEAIIEFRVKPEQAVAAVKQQILAALSAQTRDVLTNTFTFQIGCPTLHDLRYTLFGDAFAARSFGPDTGCCPAARNTPPMYLSFLGPHVKLHVGHRYAVAVQLGATTVTRTVVLQKRTTEKVILPA